MSERLKMLSVEDALAAAKEVGVRESLAPLSVYRVLLHNPDLAKSMTELLSTLLFTGKKLDVRLRELIIMRIAWVTGSNYEWSQHWRFAEHIGLAAEELVAVRDWKKADNLGAADKVVLAAVDDTLEHGKISDRVWMECATHIRSQAELVEMVVAIGHWTMFSQLLRSLEVPLEEGVDAWPPDGNASGDDNY